MQILRKKIFVACIFILLRQIAIAQGPNTWIFGRNAGLDFNSGQAVPISKETDNCYSPVSVQCDEEGNVLFYCDGKTIKDRAGDIMPGSSNAVWASPATTMAIYSNIVPMPGDTNRYYVFSISPSSGIPPFGDYYSGVLTYSIVDMRLNNGKGGIDPNYSNILLDINVSRFMLVVPGKECNYWLIVGKSSNYGVTPARLLSFKIVNENILPPVQSAINIDSMDLYQTFREFDMVYSYKYKKVIERYGAWKIVVHNFDNSTGHLTDGVTILDLSSEFISPGGGVTEPKICLSFNEKYLYLLAYINGITLRQYPINLENTVPALNNFAIVFQSDNSVYQIPTPGITGIPGIGRDCAIRLGPDKKIYMFYQTGQSFVGQINNPDNSGPACNMEPQGIQLLPNTYGSYFFPAIENKRLKVKNAYRAHDTLLCFTDPFFIKPLIENEGNYNYVWNDGSENISYLITKEGTYWVSSKGDCSDIQYTDTFIVRFETAEKCNCRMFIPNAFSPNDDQVNDIFKPTVPSTCIREAYLFKIFNRWGQVVYQTNNYFSGWNGKINGVESDMGTYHYFISYKDFHGEVKFHKGDVSLIR